MNLQIEVQSITSSLIRSAKVPEVVELHLWIDHQVKAVLIKHKIQEQVFWPMQVNQFFHNKDHQFNFSNLNSLQSLKEVLQPTYNHRLVKLTLRLKNMISRVTNHQVSSMSKMRKSTLRWNKRINKLQARCSTNFWSHRFQPYTASMKGKQLAI